MSSSTGSATVMMTDLKLLIFDFIGLIAGLFKDERD